MAPNGTQASVPLQILTHLKHLIKQYRTIWDSVINELSVPPFIGRIYFLFGIQMFEFIMLADNTHRIKILFPYTFILLMMTYIQYILSVLVIVIRFNQQLIYWLHLFVFSHWNIKNIVDPFPILKENAERRTLILVLNSVITITKKKLRGDYFEIIFLVTLNVHLNVPFWVLYFKS